MAKREFIQPNRRPERDDGMYSNGDDPLLGTQSKSPSSSSKNTEQRLGDIDKTLTENDAAMARARRSLEPDYIGESESGAANTPETNEAEEQEAEAVDAAAEDEDQDQEDDETWENNVGKSRGGRISRRKKLIGAGLATIIAGGVIGFLTIVSGPLQLVHLSQVLSGENFSNHENATTSRVGRAYRYARSGGDVTQTRVGLFGSIMYERVKASFAKNGISFTTDRFGYLDTVSVDPTKNPTLRDLTPEQAAEHVIKNNKGVTAERVSYVDGKLKVNANGLSLGDKAGLIDSTVRSQNLGEISSAMQARSAKIPLALPSWFHPLQRIGTEIDTRLAARISKSSFFEKARAERAAKLAELSDADIARNSRIRGKIQGAGRTVGTALLVAGAICIAKDVAGEIPALNRANIVLPAMKSAVDIIALGAQIENGQMPPDGLDQIGATIKNFTDKDGKTIWSSMPLSHEAGNEGGVEIDPNVKQAFDPESTAANVEEFLDENGADELCSGFGKVAQGVIGVALLFVPGAGWVTKGLTTAGGIVVLNAVTTLLPQLLNNDAVIGAVTGPEGGSEIAYGAREAGNFFFRSSGAAELSPADAAALERENEEQDKQEFQARSFASRMFDVYDHRSVVAKIIDRQTGDFGQNISNFASSFLNTTNWLSSFSSVFSAKARAQTATYEYGFPRYGFSKTDLEKSIVDNPYLNAEEAAGLLKSATGKSLIDRAKICFGVDISDTSGVWDVTHTADVNPSSGEYHEASCADPSDTWLRIRMFVFDTRTMAAYACYEGDEESCQKTGFGTTTSAVAQQNTGSPSTNCAAGTEELTGIFEGYVNNVETPLRLCAVTDLPLQRIDSDGNESTPGQEYYIPGADGKAIVSSTVSGQVVEMVSKAKADGVNLIAISSFRSIEHQTASCGPIIEVVEGGETIKVCTNRGYALPGESRHQSGTAIDFLDANRNSSANCQLPGHTVSGRCVSVGDRIWDWLDKNAANFGYKQLPRESWHWSPDGI